MKALLYIKGAGYAWILITTKETIPLIKLSLVECWSYRLIYDYHELSSLHSREIIYCLFMIAYSADGF